MPQYLLAIHLPDNFDPSTQSEATVQAINALNEEAEASGARLLAAGLGAPSEAKSVRLQPNGEVLVTDGPYLEAKEHVGGFWILEAADMDEARRGPAKAPSPAGRPARCARSHSAVCRAAHLTHRG